jgi:hypothetical protein
VNPNDQITSDRFSQIALRVRNCAPREWDEFVKAFAKATEQVTATVIDATPDTLLHAQGRAKQMHSVLHLLENCANPPAQMNPPLPATGP